MKYLAILAILSTGCLGRLEPDGLVCLNSDDPVMLESLEIAIDGWYRSSGGKINLSYIVGNEDKCDVVISKGLISENDPVGLCYSSPGRPDIVIDTFKMHSDEVVLPLILGHELGHAMGADHSTGVRDTMHSEPQLRNWPPSLSDVDQIL